MIYPACLGHRKATSLPLRLLWKYMETMDNTHCSTALFFPLWILKLPWYWYDYCCCSLSHCLRWVKFHVKWVFPWSLSSRFSEATWPGRWSHSNNYPYWDAPVCQPGLRLPYIIPSVPETLREAGVSQFHIWRGWRLCGFCCLAKTILLMVKFINKRFSLISVLSVMKQS